MANIASQKKRNARSLRERTENRRLTSAVKTHFRRLEAAVASGDAASADAEHRELCSRIDNAVSQGRPAPQHRRPQEGARGPRPGQFLSDRGAILLRFASGPAGSEPHAPMLV